MTPVWVYTLIPSFAAVLGAAIATVRRPGAVATSAVQHFAAGVIFAAAASELLPDVMHGHAPFAVIIGGVIGIALMLLIKALGTRTKGAAGLVTMVGVDLLIDGLVLGIAFVAGAKQGVLLTVALTLEVLFLGLAMTAELNEVIASKFRVVAVVCGISLLLPAGAIAGQLAGGLPPHVLAGFYSFGLIALLYLVTEELLVEAHEVPERPWVSALFFIGFLALLTIEQFTS